MHLLPGVAIQPNLELKTRPKRVLGSFPLAFALPEVSDNDERTSLLHNAVNYCCRKLNRRVVWMGNFASIIFSLGKVGGGAQICCQCHKTFSSSLMVSKIS